MSTQSKVKATAVEKVGGAIGLLGVLLKTLFSVLRYPFRSSSKLQPTFFREITRLIVRRAVTRLNVAQLQWVLPSTTTVYKDWISSKAKAEGVPAAVFTELIGDDGAKLHWVGHKDAKKVIIHFHAGGYAMPLSLGHLNLLSHIRKEVMRRSGVEVKIAILEYTLLPVNTYPTQFRQAALALKHIIDSGVSPANILITGDSAGGQLAFQIVSHILHPHPSVPRLPDLTAPFAGVLAISPWVIFESNAPSFVNNDRDIVSKKSLLEWGKLICRGTALENGGAEPGGFWAEPLKAPPEWWNDTAKATRNVMIAYGGAEAFFDDNASLAEKIREGVKGTKVDVVTATDPKGVHIGPTIDAFLGLGPTDLTKAITAWCNERLSG